MKPARKKRPYPVRKKESNPFAWTFLALFAAAFTGLMIYALNREEKNTYPVKPRIFHKQYPLTVQEENKKTPQNVLPEKAGSGVGTSNDWDEFLGVAGKKKDEDINFQATLPDFLAGETKAKKDTTDNKADFFGELKKETAVKLLSGKPVEALQNIQNSLNRKKLNADQTFKVEEFAVYLKSVINADKIICGVLEKYIGREITLPNRDCSEKVKPIKCLPDKGKLKVEIKKGTISLNKTIRVSDLESGFRLTLLKESRKISESGLLLYQSIAAVKKRQNQSAVTILSKVNNPIAVEMKELLLSYGEKGKQQVARRTFDWLLSRRKIKSGKEDLMKIKKEMAKKLPQEQVNAVMELLHDHYAEVALNKYFEKAKPLKQGEMTRTKYKTIRGLAGDYEKQYRHTGYYKTKGKQLLISFLKDGLGSYYSKFRDTRKVASIKLNLVPVEAGEFKMGQGERMQEVRISTPFWIGQHEITQDQYFRIMKTNPSAHKRKRGKYRLPVENVSWDDAVEFCRLLTETERKKGNVPENYEFRLPTAAEWEYCCRAGTSEGYSFGDTPSELHKYGNYCDKSNTASLPFQDKEHSDRFDKTSPVGTYSPNPWGIYDMHGNVWEWVLDWDGPRSCEYENPVGPEFGASKVIRGGAWDTSAENCSSSSASFESPSACFDNLGFRIVLAPIIKKKSF